MVVPGCTADELCYSTGEVAGIAIATFIVTLVLGGLGLVVTWYLWKRQKSARVTAGKLGTEEEKADDKGKFAIDNPHFRSDEPDGTTLDAAEKGKAVVSCDRPTLPGELNSKVAPAHTKHKKSRLPLTNPFTSVFYLNKKQRTMDDTDLAIEPERVMVPLRGHDFSGLGFNIFGNMRDGIFVKDVLHRGPASESGRIKAGDRILSVNVSFSNMVYEDALTILSYASPYDVQLELEKVSESNQGMSSPSESKRLGSSSFSGGGQRLFHPLYRSQSIDDLTQIGKDVIPSHAISPKRSKSIGLAAQRLRSHLDYKNGETISESVERPSTKITGSLNERMLASAMGEDEISKKMSTRSYQERKTEDISFQMGNNGKDNISDLKSRFPKPVEKEETDNIITSANIPKAEQSPDVHASSVENYVKTEEKVFICQVENQNRDKELLKETEVESSSDMSEEKTLSLPRKTATPGKRKAPAPPKPPHGVAMETKALVHCFEEENSTRNIPEVNNLLFSTKKIENGKNPIEESNLVTNGTASSVEIVSLKNLALPKITNHNQYGDSDSFREFTKTDDREEKVRRRSSSLGDINKLEEVVSQSPTLLERAMSLDFQKQLLPEENLEEQNKILRPSNFDPTENEDVFLSIQEVRKLVENTEVPTREIEAKQLKKPDITQTPHVSNSNDDVLATDDTVMMHSVKPDITLSLDSISNASTISKSSSISSVSSHSDYEKEENISTPTRRVIKVDAIHLTSDLSFDDKTSKQDHVFPQTDSSPDFSFKNPKVVNASTVHSGRKDNSAFTVDIPIILPVIRHQEKNETHSASSPPTLSPIPRLENKEVIEISKHGLDGVVTSRNDNLLKQANTSSIYTNLSTEATTKYPTESNDFESWSFEDGSENKEYTDTNYDNCSETSSSLFKTAVEIPFTSSGNVIEYSRKGFTPEISGYTVRSAEGDVTKTVIITTNENSNINYTGSSHGSDSPPPRLELPY
ncbi:uncharacterized protein LOC143227989 [Tachypleus tridentatus]|uniref:uncharacterized protein LOC143227989 n=1 Tax=Tachypleus tridentatus TaxID=6853 RepID=UPI003FD14486